MESKRKRVARLALHLGMISKNELKFIRSLKNKKYRVSEKCFLVEGVKNVLELLDSDFHVRWVAGTKEFQNSHLQELKEVNFKEISKKELNAISSLKTNESVLAVAETRDHSKKDLDNSKIIFALDGVNDPGNFGTIVRTLDWFGIHQMVCSENSVEYYNPKVISATMGSFTRVKVVYTDLFSFLDAAECPIVGADMSGIDLKNWQPHDPMIVVMGSESHGLSQEVRSLLDEVISIKCHGRAESLNVGVATGIISAKITQSL